jgi:hypothetical protein
MSDAISDAGGAMAAAAVRFATTGGDVLTPGGLLTDAEASTP